jgi:hypothetical protein
VKLTYSLATTILLLTVLGLGIYGMGRSLWLDEAWVANSVQTKSLAGMFYYPDWLQVNPPLFLLLARAAVRVLGASSAAFRVVPLSMALVAAASMLAVSRQLLRPSLALLATAVVVFNQTAIEYSRTLKPYSGELAATAILLLAAARYVREPDRRRYVWLLAAVAIAMPLAYPAVFILPGIVLAVALVPPAKARCSEAPGSSLGRTLVQWRRSAAIAALSGGILLALYWFSIRPNLAPELRDFWAVDVDHGMTTGLWFALVFCLAAAVRAASGMLRGTPGPRDWAMILCLLPCLLLAASGALGLYPVSHRTRLFALPCLALAAAMTAEDLLRRWLDRWFDRQATEVTVLALTLCIACHAAGAEVIERRAVADEDFAAAVRFLEQRLKPGDLLLVHASSKEGFLLYSRMDGWNPPNVLYGNTGWPCCARGKNGRPGVSTARAVSRDLYAMIPRGYSGRIWILHTTRPSHWSYVGLNEGELWHDDLLDRGCLAGPFLRFENLAITPIDCVDAQ